MAVAFDAVGPSGGGGVTTATSPATWTHICASTATHLLVGATFDKNPDTGGTMSATYAGVSMTSKGIWHTGGATAGFLQFWSLDVPGGLVTGSNTVSVTFAGTPSGVNAGSVSFTGSGALSSVQSAVSAGVTANPALTFGGSVSGNMVAAFMGSGTQGTQSGSFTQRFNVTGDGVAGAGFVAGATIASPGGNTTASWTMAADDWAVAAIEVQVPSGPAVTGPALYPEYMQSTPALIVTNAGWRGANHSLP